MSFENRGGWTPTFAEEYSVSSLLQLLLHWFEEDIRLARRIFGQEKTAQSDHTGDKIGHSIGKGMLTLSRFSTLHPAG